MDGEIVVYNNTNNFYVESPSPSSASSNNNNTGVDKLLGDAIINSTTTCSTQIYFRDEDLLIKSHNNNDDNNNSEDTDKVRRGRGQSSSSTSRYAWIGLQICCKLLFSFLSALLVFYLLTKPKPPLFSVQNTELKEFEITEGVDSSGVATSYLTINISMLVTIENKSQIYSMNTTTPLLEIHFGPRPKPLSISKGTTSVHARSRERVTFTTYGGTHNEAVYGAGRDMRDMLRSPHGLPLVLTLGFDSYYRVVGSLVRPVFRHRARCFFTIQSVYDFPVRPPRPYNSTCLVVTS